MLNSHETTTVLLCGVGGQGTILAADLLARAAMASGVQVKVSEIHGMSQRGGAVTTVVRFGKDVKSMVADKGCCDCVVSFEKMEALRNLPFLKKGGFLLVNDEVIKPQSVATGKAAMPPRMNQDLEAEGAVLIPAAPLAAEAGTAKAANVVLLGALSASLDFTEETWVECIKQRVPEKFVDANLKAFAAGRAFAQR
ncbi:MAG: indolepyruvate oxidoreductase subunit beta [Coriobacteriia bacterium]|nr:indolepyruvate oxidoreductase subunit beta [Coriobacteriia bacterium]